MKPSLPQRIIALSLVFLFAPLGTVWAATNWGGCLGGPDNDVATIQCLVPLFGNVVIALVELAAVGLFIMFVVAGFSFLTSGGNPKQLEKAKNTLTYAILGVVIIVVAYLIIKLIGVFTGVTNLDVFSIPGSSQKL